MIYTNPNKKDLPDIQQLLGHIRECVNGFPVRHLMPYDHRIEGDNLFILNRTASGLFTLMPNVTTQACLYCGVPHFGHPLTATWNFTERRDVVVQNMLREQFELVMESHPLYNLLTRGVNVTNGRFRMINPYGIATAYGFPSPMVTFTSSLEVAAFYATHVKDADGQWRPVPAENENGEANTGTVYALYLAHPFPIMVGLSTIGKQVFRRPGNQRLFGFQVAKGMDLRSHPLVTGFEFKQSPDAARQFNAMANDVDPDELIAQKARAIIDGNQISQAAFDRNCRNNPTDNRDANARLLSEAGITIVANDPFVFTQQEIDRFGDMQDEWMTLFQDVTTLHPGFDSILTDLLQLDIHQALNL